MLETSNSHCNERQRIIVSSDRGGCVHRAINDEVCRVRQYRIDGEVYKEDGERCDWLLLNDDWEEVYYIELKGSDISKAIQQIISTEKLFAEELKHYTSFYRIIYKTGSHGVNSSRTVRWKERCGRDARTGKAVAVVKNRLYEENI